MRVTEEQRHSWERDGFFRIEGFAEPAVCEAMLDRVIDIARRFSTYEATQFINGILDAIKRDLDQESPETEAALAATEEDDDSEEQNAAMPSAE